MAVISRLMHRSRRDAERGSMAVELAIAAPVLVMLALGVADYGTLMHKSAALRGATRAGAEYVKAVWNSPAVTNPIAGAEQQVCGFLGLTLSGTSCSPVTPAVSTACTCPGNNDSAVTCPSSTGSNPCSAYTSDPRVVISVTVAATETITPIISWPGFPSSVSASTAIRTQ